MGLADRKEVSRIGGSTLAKQDVVHDLAGLTQAAVRQQLPCLWQRLVKVNRATADEIR